MSKYYNGDKIRTILDRKGELPEIVIVDGNRSAGKTVNFNNYVFQQFLKHGKKFGLLYRYKYEISEISNKFFKDIKAIYNYSGEFTEKSKSYGSYHELYYNGKSCGYAFAINSAEQIKKQSHEFSDIDYILFDEFQSEYNSYASNEINKFISIHTSIARGQGKQQRFVRVFMLSNSIDVNNPYYNALGISKKMLLNGSKFIRGNGYVIERNFTESAVEAMKQSSFLNAFSNSDYFNILTKNNSYLQNSDNLILTNYDLSNFRYYFTIKHDQKLFGVWENGELILITENVNSEFPRRYVLTRDNITTDNRYILINPKLVTILRNYFDNSRLYATSISGVDIINLIN